jgi:hypothetical protein
MTLAALFAFLLQSGVCARTEFQAPDGSRLAVIVCPQAVPEEEAPKGKPT